ncbi:MAG: hypothetical protein Ta2D_06070 [Rickettsiales bacterium]|nr:MAG: hypothetical protein Ta2D_06070 [Rickettsiales bacterium]
MKIQSNEQISGKKVGNKHTIPLKTTPVKAPEPPKIEVPVVVEPPKKKANVVKKNTAPAKLIINDEIRQNEIANFYQNHINKKHNIKTVEQKQKDKDSISDLEKSVKMEQGADNTEAAKALAKMRIIINFLLMIPLLAAIAGLSAYIMMNIFPSLFYLLKKIITGF